MRIVDTLEFLLGTWELGRSIEDRRSHISGYFRGTAVVALGSSPSGGGGCRATYDEGGELCLGAHTGPASRHLELATRPDSRVVVISFADGRPFVDLDIRAGEWRALHDCGADCYELVTVVQSHCVVEERWHVRGPGKDYDAVTTLTRIRA